MYTFYSGAPKLLPLILIAYFQQKNTIFYSPFVNLNYCSGCIRIFRNPYN